MWVGLPIKLMGPSFIPRTKSSGPHVGSPHVGPLWPQLGPTCNCSLGQARRRDSVTEEGRNKFWRGTRRIREGYGDTRNLFYCGLKEQGRRSSFQKLYEIRCESTKLTKIRAENTNLGVLGLDFHSNSPSLLISLGHSPRLGGGTIFVWGAQAVIWGGTAPGCPSWRRACYATAADWLKTEKNFADRFQKHKCLAMKMKNKKIKSSTKIGTDFVFNL